MVEQCRHHGEDEQGEADPEQADEREELAPQQDLHGENEIVVQHWRFM
jgi:hypothetical protein